MKVSRRRFLQSSGAVLLASSPVAAFSAPPVERFAKMILKDAASLTSGTDTHNYIALLLHDAPPRWIFDQFMKTRDGEAQIFNPMVATRLNGQSGVYNGSEYATVRKGSLLVPSLWDTQVAKAGGGQRPFSDLLNHMITFRGYGTGVDGHPANLLKHFNPIPGVGSITGHAADHSNALIKAAQYPAGIGGLTGFSSPKGAGIAAVHELEPRGNVLNAIFSSFTKRPEVQTLEQTRSRYRDVIQSASDALKRIAVKRNPASAAMTVDQDRALESLGKGIADLDSAWGPLYQKYLGLLVSTFQDRTVPGLTDKPVIAPADENFESPFMFEADNGVIYYPAPGSDLRDWLNSVDFARAAQAFAFAEFVITRGYGSAIELGNLTPRNFVVTAYRTNTERFASPQTRALNLRIDQHATGHVAGTLINGCMYRALGAALNELVDQLKTAKVFDKTVIQIVTEFGRTPRDSGGGADHGFDSMVSSVITGKNSAGPLVVGNILRSGGTFPPNYAGTYGHKALTQVWGETVSLTPAHVASSIAQLLNFSSNPWGNLAKPLFVVENGQITLKSSAEIV